MQLKKKWFIIPCCNCREHSPPPPLLFCAARNALLLIVGAPFSTDSVITSHIKERNFSKNDYEYSLGQEYLKNFCIVQFKSCKILNAEMHLERCELFKVPFQQSTLQKVKILWSAVSLCVGAELHHHGA